MFAIIVNGNLVPSNEPCIKHNDRGFTLGHGVFETMLVKKSTIPAIRYHWKRLESSLKSINITIPFSYPEFSAMILQLITHNQLQDKIAVARMTVSQGESERGILAPCQIKPNFVLSVLGYTPMFSEKYSALVVSLKKNESSITSRIKSISYLDNIFAKKEAVEKGFNEAFLLNSKNNVADGAIANIFIVKDKQIFTPFISDGALPGIIRRILLEEFSKDFSITEHTISKYMLMDADEIFITNALIGVQPVNKLNDLNLSDTKTGLMIRQALINNNYI